MTTDSKKIAVVTGANRGLGLETCKQLAKLDITVILTCRDVAKGEKAQQALQQRGIDIIFHPLEVTDDKSITQLYQFVSDKFGHLEILVNNAGIFPDSSGITGKEASIFVSKIDTIRQAMETNVYGALRMCQTFIPLMKQRNYGRIVNLSSGMGQLTEMNGSYPGYRISKTGLNAVTRIFHDELQNTNVLINSMCPGWVRTDMGGPNAPRSLDEGVDTIVWLATLPDGGPSGGFFRDRKVIPW